MSLGSSLVSLGVASTSYPQGSEQMPGIRVPEAREWECQGRGIRAWQQKVTALPPSRPLQVVRVLAMWETWVPSLSWEDPREKEAATHSRILAWRIPWTEEPGRLQSMGPQRVGHD